MLKPGDFVSWLGEEAVTVTDYSMRGFVVADYDSGICLKVLRGGYGPSTIKRYVPDEFHHLLNEDVKCYNTWDQSHRFKIVELSAEDIKKAKALGILPSSSSSFSGDPYSANDGSGRTSVYIQNPETTAFEFL